VYTLKYTTDFSVVQVFVLVRGGTNFFRLVREALPLAVQTETRYMYPAGQAGSPAKFALQ
jgi:hypothetical protein